MYSIFHIPFSQFYLSVLVSVKVYNLGTGTGYSVLQMVNAMEKASGRKVSGKPAVVQSTYLQFIYACIYNLFSLWPPL